MTLESVEIAKRIECRVPPERAIPVTVQVIPQSVCFFYHPEAPGRRLQLDADDQGLVRFHARALTGAEPTEFHLECRGGDGQMELYTISLSSDIHYTAAMNGDELEPAAMVEGEERPALEGDPMAPSNLELVSRGYPPRPDPEKAPAQYARWLKNVSRSYTRISTRLAAHPEYGEVKRGPFEKSLPSAPRGGTFRQGQQTAAGWTDNHISSSWCGAYYTHPINQFAYIQADWIVPQVFDFPKSPGFSAVVEWVGLDNAKVDLYQAGTGSECYTIFGYQITTYFMWMESLPWNWWEIPNFPVSPGDEVSVDIWVANEFGTTIYEDGSFDGLTCEENNVWFYMNNATNGASFMGTYPTAPESVYGLHNTGFSGYTAEFILERPTINGIVTPLALFTPTPMTSCSYGDAEDGEYNMFALGADNGIPPFDGKLTYLNMVDPRNQHRLLVEPVSIPDPNNGADAQAILFARQNCP
jgi:hypothetical protein